MQIKDARSILTKFESNRPRFAKLSHVKQFFNECEKLNSRHLIEWQCPAKNPFDLEEYRNLSADVTDVQTFFFQRAHVESRSCCILRLTCESRGMYLRRLVRICSNTPATSVQTLARERNGSHVDLPPSFRRGGCRGFHVTFLRGSIHQGKTIFIRYCVFCTAVFTYRNHRYVRTYHCPSLDDQIIS